MSWQLFLVVLSLKLSLNIAIVKFPVLLFVKPGDDFDLDCSIDFEGVIDKIYHPKEDIPSGRELEKESQLIPNERFLDEAERLKSLYYRSATEEDHQGYYTCISYRKTGFPRVETATCYVIVKDPCDDVTCPARHTCVSDMETFTHECVPPPTTQPPPTTKPPTTQPPTTKPPTTEPKAPTEPPGSLPVCSTFPGGAIEQFDTVSSYYDLACSHVLAADFLPGGDFTQAWYIYGTFDQHDGNTALSAITIFAGTTVFEFQRGWKVNIGKGKFEIEEDVPRTFGNCEITFTGLHLKAECPHFAAYYDGLMSGHVILGNSQTPLSTENPVKSGSSLGLCWDNDSGFRANWQVAHSPQCKVDPQQDACEVTDECDNFKNALILGDQSSGMGAYDSCGQLHCEEMVPTPAQQCALNRADSVNRSLKSGGQAAEGMVEGCPEEECEWKLDLLSRGCPQKNPPFKC